MTVHYGVKVIMAEQWGFGPPLGLELKYRLRWRWGFWQVQEGGRHLTYDETDGWQVLKSYIRKDEAIAHLVKLKLEGKNVEL